MSIFEIGSRRHFLIDSGADESVFPARQCDRILPHTSDLIAANGSIIRTYGRRRLPISFKDGPIFHQEFWIADVSRPLLGADFFRDHHLLIDFSNAVSPARPRLDPTSRPFYRVPLVSVVFRECAFLLWVRLRESWRNSRPSWNRILEVR